MTDPFDKESARDYKKIEIMYEYVYDEDKLINGERFSLKLNGSEFAARKIVFIKEYGEPPKLEID